MGMAVPAHDAGDQLMASIGEASQAAAAAIAAEAQRTIDQWSSTWCVLRLPVSQLIRDAGGLTIYPILCPTMHRVDVPVSTTDGPAWFARLLPHLPATVEDNIVRHLALPSGTTYSVLDRECAQPVVLLFFYPDPPATPGRSGRWARLVAQTSEPEKPRASSTERCVYTARPFSPSFAVVCMDNFGVSIPRPTNHPVS